MNKTVLFIVWAFCVLTLNAQNQLPKWEKGYLDIHNINTGRGSEVTPKSWTLN